ncbi:FAD/NAD-P-binding domain-containing protein [Mycena latifolia]|nr:FAD/NAD-P-binding domain-containing protein [Mycena latifolia]
MVVWQNIVLFSTAIIPVIAQQRVFDSSEDPDSPWTTFPHPINRVAVIGAGVAGLQAASYLLAANLTVRLFERAPSPGGTWFYTEETPPREAYPGGEVKEPEPLPKEFPHVIYYNEGDDGIRLEDRWNEHWHPRAVWYDLHTNTPTVMTGLPGIKYPPNLPWAVSVHDVQRHVRAYASLHGINSNDESSDRIITSYSTRVEEVKKRNSTGWTLTLRRLERLPESNRIKAEYWTEEFDAVVVATGPFTWPHVPAIEGIGAWSKAKQDGRYSMYHSQSFRHPERYFGKTVLIVGACISATQIAQTIAPFVKRLFASVRPNPARDAAGRSLLFRFPNTTEIVPEISSFEPLDENTIGIKEGKIQLVNGTILEGIDEIILATGYRRNTFLPDLVSPRLNNLHWTGHYIHDPTLAYTSALPWTHGRYQSYAFAKVWTGKARLPNHQRMWQDYQDGKYQFGTPKDFLLQRVALVRQYVAWLNSESLELGGSFVEPPPLEDREINAYFLNSRWDRTVLTHETYTWFDDLPSSEWAEPRGTPSFQPEYGEAFW